MRAPRGFWVPAAVLSRELGLPIARDFLRDVPRDGLERNLEALAERRLFCVAERVDELDPVSRNAVLFLLHGSFGARARYLGAVCRWAVRPPGTAGPLAGPPGVGGVCVKRGGTSGNIAPPSRARRPTRTERARTHAPAAADSAPGLPLLLVPAGDRLARREPDSGEAAHVRHQFLRSMIREARPITKGWHVRTKHPCSR